MNSLVLFTHGPFQSFDVYPRHADCQLVIVYMGKPEIEHDVEKGVVWYVVSADAFLGPVYVQVLMPTGWKPVPMAEVASELAKHGLVAVTVWEVDFEVARNGNVYKYLYTVQSRRAANQEPFDWISVDVRRRCEAHEPRARIVGENDPSMLGQLSFDDWDEWNSGILVEDGPEYQIWLNITDIQASVSDEEGES